MDRAWVYMMASRRHGTLYVGVSTDLPRRAYTHREGLVPGFTKRFGVRILVWMEPHPDIASARRREHQIKRWRRAWKIALIEEQNPDWRDLYPALNR